MKTLWTLLVTIVLMMTMLVPVSADDATLYTYEELEDGTLRLTGSNDVSDPLILPSHIDGKAVTVLGDCLYLRSGNLGTVIVPDTVKVIERAAFQESRVQQIFLPEGLEVIEQGAFFACADLYSVVVPSTVTTIGERAFGYGYYVDPENPDLIPGSVGVYEDFTLITNNDVAELYAAENGVVTKRIADCEKGDADFDGIVTSKDARLLIGYLLGGYTRVWAVADMNDSGDVDTADVRLILSQLIAV